MTGNLESIVVVVVVVVAVVAVVVVVVVAGTFLRPSVRLPERPQQRRGDASSHRTAPYRSAPFRPVPSAVSRGAVCAIELCPRACVQSARVRLGSVAQCVK